MASALLAFAREKHLLASAGAVFTEAWNGPTRTGAASRSGVLVRALPVQVHPAVFSMWPEGVEFSAERRCFLWVLVRSLGVQIQRARKILSKALLFCC